MLHTTFYYTNVQKKHYKINHFYEMDKKNKIKNATPKGVSPSHQKKSAQPAKVALKNDSIKSPAKRLQNYKVVFHSPCRLQYS